MNEAGEVIIGWHLVRDALSDWRNRGDALEIAGADRAQAHRLERVYEFGISNASAVGRTRCQHHLVEDVELAGAVDERMAGQNLLNQRRPGPRHGQQQPGRLVEGADKMCRRGINGDDQIESGAILIARRKHSIAAPNLPF